MQAGEDDGAASSHMLWLHHRTRLSNSGQNNLHFPDALRKITSSFTVVFRTVNVSLFLLLAVLVIRQPTIQTPSVRREKDALPIASASFVHNQREVGLVKARIRYSRKDRTVHIIVN